MAGFKFDKQAPTILDYIRDIDTSDAEAVQAAQDSFIAALVEYQREERKAKQEWEAKNRKAIDKGKEMFREYLDILEDKKKKYLELAEVEALEESGLKKYADDMGMEVSDFRSRRTDK